MTDDRRSDRTYLIPRPGDGAERTEKNINSSLQYCRDRVLNSDNVRGLTSVNWDNAAEQSSRKIFEMFGLTETEWVLTNNDGKHLSVEIVFNPHIGFEYFLTEQFVNDGTFIFTLELFERIIKKIVYANTFYRPRGEHRFGKDKVRYVLGNFVVINEYGGNFSDKPWPLCRTTVLLPLRYERESISEACLANGEQYSGKSET